MTKTTWKEYEAELEWARLREDNRDMGPGDDSDVGRKITEQDGQYTLDMIVTDDVKAQMLKDGIPEAPLGHNQFKPTDDGRWRYKAKRPHLAVKMLDDDGNPTVMGPPVVLDYKASKEANAAVEIEENVGNGSKAIVKLAIWKGRGTIVTLDKVGVTDLVEYEAEERWF